MKKILFLLQLLLVFLCFAIKTFLPKLPTHIQKGLCGRFNLYVQNLE